jgi:hypothetical protein
MGTRLKHIHEKKVDTNFWCTKEIASARAAAVAAGVVAVVAAVVALPPLQWQQSHRRQQ